MHDRVSEDLDILAGLVAAGRAHPRASRIIAHAPSSPRCNARFAASSTSAASSATCSSSPRTFGDDPTRAIPRAYHGAFHAARADDGHDRRRAHDRDSALFDAAGFDLDEVARRGADFYLHDDLHARLLSTPIRTRETSCCCRDNVIGLVDFGMVGRIDDTLREQDRRHARWRSCEHDVPMLTCGSSSGSGRRPPQLDRSRAQPRRRRFRLALRQRSRSNQLEPRRGADAT